MTYDTWMRYADGALARHGLTIVDNAGGGDCVLHAIAPLYSAHPSLSALRAHIVGALVANFPLDADADRRNGDERSLTAWEARLRAPHAYLPPELVARVVGELDRPELSVRLWCVPSTATLDASDSTASARADHREFELYTNARARPGERADVELLHIEAIRHVVALRPTTPPPPSTLTLDAQPLFVGQPIRVHPALIVGDDDDDQEALRRSIDAYFARRQAASRVSG